MQVSSQRLFMNSPEKEEHLNEEINKFNVLETLKSLTKLELKKKCEGTREIV